MFPGALRVAPLLLIRTLTHQSLVWRLLGRLGANIDGAKERLPAFRIEDDLAGGGFVMRAVVLFGAAVGGRGDDLIWIKLGIDRLANRNRIA